MDEATIKPVYIVLKKTAYKKSIKESYESKAAKSIGILHIICGLVSLATGIVLRIIVPGHTFMLGLLGTGISCSFFFFIIGFLSLASARNGNPRLVIATLVFGVLSSVAASTLVIMSGTSLGVDNCYENWTGSYKWYCASGVLYTMNLLQLLAGILELLLAIASARLSCRATCCRDKLDTTSIPDMMILGPEDVDYDQIIAMRQTKHTNMKPSFSSQRPANLYSQLQLRVREFAEKGMGEEHKERGDCVKNEENYEFVL
eukprot:GFUD01035985.1.p1 GENE.GFUD01035985.1~~GFUD01035985.1.p1  ORF type:complete len:259 (+),score=37.18 GFUD01035985.1:79-855(+)